MEKQIKHDCEFCEYRHSKCSYNIDNIPKDNCPEFVLGRCFSCQLNGSNDGDCIEHQMAFNWCGCNKYIEKEVDENDASKCRL